MPLLTPVVQCPYSKARSQKTKTYFDSPQQSSSVREQSYLPFFFGTFPPIAHVKLSRLAVLITAIYQHRFLPQNISPSTRRYLSQILQFLTKTIVHQITIKCSLVLVSLPLLFTLCSLRLLQYCKYWYRVHLLQLLTFISQFRSSVYSTAELSHHDNTQTPINHSIHSHVSYTSRVYLTTNTSYLAANLKLWASIGAALSRRWRTHVFQSSLFIHTSNISRSLDTAYLHWQYYILLQYPVMVLQYQQDKIEDWKSKSEIWWRE